MTTARSEQECFIYDALKFALSEAGLGDLPSCYTIHDDDATTIEWIDDHGRLGFNIEKDPKESGWYVLVRGGDRSILRDWGHMDTFDADKIVRLFWVRTTNLPDGWYRMRRDTRVDSITYIKDGAVDWGKGPPVNFLTNMPDGNNYTFERVVVMTEAAYKDLLDHYDARKPRE